MSSWEYALPEIRIINYSVDDLGQIVFDAFNPGNYDWKYDPMSDKFKGTPKINNCSETQVKLKVEKFPYKYNEDKILQKLDEYIKSTYSEHYVGEDDSIQAIDLIMQRKDGLGFILGDIMKYAFRFGEKAKTAVEKEALKILHYGVFLYHFSVLRNK